MPVPIHRQTHHYRRKPNEEELQPLFAAWSRALERMPVLESATVYFHLWMLVRRGERVEQLVKRPWLVAYQAPGALSWPAAEEDWASKLRAEELGRARLVFQCVSGWRPKKETMNRLASLSAERPLLLEVDAWYDARVVED